MSVFKFIWDMACASVLAQSVAGDVSWNTRSIALEDTTRFSRTQKGSLKHRHEREAHEEGPCNVHRGTFALGIESFLGR